MELITSLESVRIVTNSDFSLKTLPPAYALAQHFQVTFSYYTDIPAGN